MTPSAPKSRLKHLLKVTREYFTEWAVAGTVIALTGFAPDHWVADLFKHLAIPESLRDGWLRAIDFRLGLVAVGIAIISWDVLRRSGLERQVALAGGGAAPNSAPEIGRTAGDHAVGDAATPALSDKPSIAVMPFENMSGDPEQEYFADGMVEEIITTLSYWRWFPVIARNSTFAYKRKPKNATEIGRELGASYLVEGGVRRVGNRVRITAQLTEVSTGRQLWADRFERDLDSVFSLQEEIAECVVVNIEPEIHQAERQRVQRTRPENLGAWDYSLKALSLLERMNRASHEEARGLLEKSVALDPHSAYAWSMLALCHYHEGILGWKKDRASALKASLQAAEQAVQNDDRDWLGHALRGMGLLWTERDFATALEEQERAVSLNPSAPLARHCLACVFEFSRRPAEAIPHIDALLRLDPHYRFASLAHADVSLCQFLLDQPEAAWSAAVKAVRLQTGNVRARQRLVAALSALGRAEEARAAAAELIRLQPDFGIDYIDTTYPFQAADDRLRFVEALQRAGLLSN